MRLSGTRLFHLAPVPVSPLGGGVPTDLSQTIFLFILKKRGKKEQLIERFLSKGIILSYFFSFSFFFRKYHAHFVNCKYSGKCISSPPPLSTSRFIHLFNFARAFPPLTHVWKNWKQVKRRVEYILVHKYISTNHRLENSDQESTRFFSFLSR